MLPHENSFLLQEDDEHLSYPSVRNQEQNNCQKSHDSQPCICYFETPFIIEKPDCPNFRTITAINFDVPAFRILQYLIFTYESQL